MATFLDETGLRTLWSKVKSTFLPLSGGTVTGDVNFLGNTEISNLNCVGGNNIVISDIDGEETPGIILDGMTGDTLHILKDGIKSVQNGNSHTCWSTDGNRVDINALISSQIQNYTPISSFVTDISSHYSVITNVSSFDDGVMWSEIAPNPDDLTFYFAGSSSSNGSKYYPCVKYDNYTRFKGYLWEELFFGTKYSYVAEVMRSSTDNTESGEIEGVKARIFKIGSVYFAPNRMDDGESVIRYSNFSSALDGLINNIFPPKK